VRHHDGWIERCKIERRNWDVVIPGKTNHANKSIPTRCLLVQFTDSVRFWGWHNQTKATHDTEESIWNRRRAKDGAGYPRIGSITVAPSYSTSFPPPP
jgi:hypothetical protein